MNKLISRLCCYSILLVLSTSIRAEITPFPVEMMSIIPTYSVVLSDRELALGHLEDIQEQTYQEGETLENNLQNAANQLVGIIPKYDCYQNNILLFINKLKINWAVEDSLWKFIVELNHWFNLRFSILYIEQDNISETLSFEKLSLLDDIDFASTAEWKSIEKWLLDKRYQVLISPNDKDVYTSSLMAGGNLYKAFINNNHQFGGIEKVALSSYGTERKEDTVWSIKGEGLKAFKSKRVITWHPSLHESIELHKNILLDQDHPLSNKLTQEQLSYYRSKKSLGRMVHAKPVLLENSKRNQWRDDIAKESYNAWQPNRGKKSLWLATTDGMLHVLDDENGEELLAYMPAFLASDEIGNRSAVMLDATPTIADAYFHNSWRTVVAATAGAGGKGVYVLEVANNIESTKVLWEFVHPDLGYSLSTPVMGKLANGRWAVLVNNGYESSAKKSSVFVIYLDADLSDGWTAGIDYLRLEVPGNDASLNGLSALTAVSLEVNSENISFTSDQGIGDINRLYAGDLQGQFWVFDLSSTNPKYWGAQLLFSGLEYQSIVHAAEVYALDRGVSCASQPCDKSLLLIFGTGKLIEKSDREDQSLQSLYVIRDFISSSDSTYKRSDLLSRGVKDLNKNWNHKAGWYMDFEKSTERLQLSPSVIFDQLLFQTVQLDMDFCSSQVSSKFYRMPLFPQTNNVTTSVMPEDTDKELVMTTDIGHWPAELLLGSDGQGLYLSNAKGDVKAIRDFEQHKPFQGVLRKAELYLD